ncbi:transcription elongation factor B polypeptide 3-like isoform X2 [Macrobrachium nipponense]
MARDDVIEQISLFQRKLEKYAKSGETDKVLYYIHKLKYLQVTVKHLEATGVGRTVNSLRHHSGLVGNKARDLVNKWKKMVSAEDSEEEEEEEEDDDVEYDRRTEGENDVVLRDQNGDDIDDEEEDDRLQIEENGSESNVPVPEYKPTLSDHDIGDDSPGGGNDNSYNPLTSKMDYQLLNTATPSREYHPSSIRVNNSHCSSPEDEASGWEDASPSTSADRRIESSSKSSKKSSREDKERHKKKEKNREKERSKDSSSSQEKEKRKDHKHKAKHKEKDKDREEKKKSKSHKHKDKDRHEEKPKEKKSEENGEKSKSDKDKKRYVVNGYGALDPGESKSYSAKPEREVERRDSEDKRKDKNSSSNSSSHRKEEKNREKEVVMIQEKESSDSEQEVLIKENRVKDSGKDREKSKHHDRHSSNSSKKEKSKHDHESQREEEGKKKKNKRSKEEESDFGAALMGFDSPSKKKKKKKKKDRKERESSDDEQPSSSKSHKRTLTDGEIPEPKKPKLLESTPQKLPKLPSSFSGAVLESPLLPEITPNYKPLPRLPIREEPANQIHSKMSEEETLNIMLQSKSGRRSKMYSGRSTGLQYVPTLYDSCIRVMIENIDAIEATGNIPFHILRPVLERATPQQLNNIEDFNPYLLEDTDPLWENHCKRDFRNRSLEDMETWRELWWRCHDEREKKFKSLTENLQQKFISQAEPKRQIKLAFVNDAIKVPKSVARAQAKYGTGIPSGSAVKPGKANEVAARKTAMHNAQRAEKAAAAPRPTSAKNKKVAPLMAKTRQFYKKAFRR